ncbi:MAG: hypothetical protein JWO78_970 [Micavibrio sp.]|nr:hypothetical protein [Micavibrio sp.]
MSAAIKKALSNLDKAIDRMEGNIAKRPKSSKVAPQPDLFSTPAPASNVVGFDRNALAKKLDMTIAKVEQLLSEA